MSEENKRTSAQEDYYQYKLEREQERDQEKDQEGIVEQWFKFGLFVVVFMFVVLVMRTCNDTFRYLQYAPLDIP